ncbi:MAG TPA: NAD(P)/FAD-dependent oxidoreductase [Phnomibacter sp.]|nr:NAD(P)/FAD-dependent oxidoreductase [Phnomibacter sp.]
MQQTISFKLLPAEAANPQTIKKLVAREQGVSVQQVSGFYIRKSSIDARSKTVWVNLQVQAFIDEPFVERPTQTFHFHDVHHAERKVIIVGAGPAGLFAALHCLEQGIKPIILERGKDVRSRRRDLAAMNKQGEVNAESNYCFGEGGAGTYSDGKLYTRSTKRGDVNSILHMLVHFGADERILYEAHPHIGTNKLPHIISAMRQHIIACGGEVHFDAKVTDLVLQNDVLVALKTAEGETWKGDAFILATGHSARDIFALLHAKKIAIEAKPFALGVRAEHPQHIIDAAQYHCLVRSEFLPPASYSLVHQADGRGVFSFCMCPGGIIAPAATAPGEIVVNGWSPSKRNNPYANSGMVVEIRLQDLQSIQHDFTSVTQMPKEVLQGPLAMMYFQQYVERKCFVAGGGKLVAPAQRLTDFVQRKRSGDLPDCSYLPGIASADLSSVLPAFVSKTLRDGFVAFGNKMKGYYTSEAVVVATESRTSSPVRIPRNNETYEHPQIKNLFPCAEGAGYAGGIVSAAMDGVNTVQKIAARYA